MVLGYFGLVLHGHIPWCKKSGTWPAGEEWLLEAINETYIPFLNILRELKENGIKTAVTVNITPILAEQLADEYMKQRFTEYMEGLIARCKAAIIRFNNNHPQKRITEYYLNKFEHVLDTYYHNYYRDILGTFKWLQSEKMIELITSAATHGFLPLLESDSGIFSQIETAVDTHKQYFDQEPRGLWLPECAYRPKEYRDGKIRESIDYWLHNSGIQYFFVDSHGIINAEMIESKNPIGLTTNFGYKLNTGVCVFGRNQYTSRQVWDLNIGYPGNEYYREFHKKDPESGLNCWRITGKDVKNENKQLYEVEKAKEQVQKHAKHFISLLSKEAEEFHTKHQRRGIIVSPYDFELYGHWWMEGIDWLKNVFESLAHNEIISMITFSDYIARYKEQFSSIQMKESSWGEGGHFQVWKNPEHGWIWPYINSSIKQLEEILKGNVKLREFEQRVLKQAARELLLMEGSDWPFLLHTRQAKEYANQRFHHHHQRFNRLIWAAKDLQDRKRISPQDLSEIESIDSCFQDLNIDYFRKINEK
jgi:1,4-alpha-glucan branching enzyme